MKTLFCLAMTVGMLGLSISAQTQMSDKDLDGFKGPVKSALEEFQEVRGIKGQKPDPKRRTQNHVFFNKEGQITEIIYQHSNNKLIFKQIDGFKTFSSVKLGPEPDNANRFTVINDDEQPIEPNEKITAPDKRFEFKYVYEYDKNGRIKSERQFENNGKLFRLRTFEYSKDGKIEKEIQNDTVAIQQYRYKYDSDGNLIETLKDRDIKGAGTDSTSRTVYSDIKVDQHGNWIQRKKEYFYSNKGNPIFKLPSEKWDVEYMEYRTITYH